MLNEHMYVNMDKMSIQRDREWKYLLTSELYSVAEACAPERVAKAICAAFAHGMCEGYVHGTYEHSVCSPPATQSEPEVRMLDSNGTRVGWYHNGRMVAVAWKCY